jgi:23S rRNA (adenine2503-C2)-methyltransferase
MYYLCYKMMDTNQKTKLLGMTLAQLKAVAESAGLRSFSAGQIADWLYKKRVASIDQMTNIPAAKRTALDESYEVGAEPPIDSVKSVDGTIKYLFGAGEGKSIESVYIPTESRATLCVSSQVGCKMHCSFCMTGRQGFNGNLTSGDMINQIQSIPESEQLTNVVFMGMGEPLDNTDELMKALEILTSPYGYGWSPKRITVSTIGAKGLKRFLDESECHLAISLHSPFHEERLSLMPVEEAFPIEDVLSVIRQYDFSHQRRVSFEYIMFSGLNDSSRHATALAHLLQGIPCRVNLIRFHAIPDSELKSCDLFTMEHFRDSLNAKGVVATIRASRGEDIFAACGMLSTLKNNQKSDKS